MTQSTKDIEIFDVEEESTGWTRVIDFTYKGNLGKMLLAWNANDDYTNCEVLEYPKFTNEQDEDSFDGWFESITPEQWDVASDKYQKEN